MSVKSIVLKAVIGCLVLGALLWLLVMFSAPEQKAETEKYSVLSFDDTKIERIEIKSDDLFVLNCAGGQWEMEGMEGIKVNSAYASALAKSMSNLSSPDEAMEGADLSVYGLDEPNTEIKLVLTDGEKTVKIGNDSGNYSYVTVDGKNVYIVSKKDLHMAFLDKMSYLDTTAFSADIESIDYVSFSDIVLVKQNSDWQEEKPYNLLTDSSLVKSKIIEPVSSIQSVDIVKKETVDLINKTKVTIGLGDTKEEFYISEGEEQSYLYYDNSDYVYVLKNSSAEFLSVTGFELILKYVAPISLSEIAEIKFIAPDKTTLLTVEAPSTEAPVFYKNGKEVTEESFRSFYQILMGLTFNSEGKADGNAEYTIIFTKETNDVTMVEFIPFNESEYAIKINGKTDFVLLKKSVTDIFGYLKNLQEV